jgi:hypothetical protein
MTDGEWELVGSSDQTPIGIERWAVAKLLELAHHPSVDLRLHTVRRRNDGALSLALMISPSEVDYVPLEIRAALEATDGQLIPLAVVSGSPADFSREWEDLGRLPLE